MNLGDHWHREGCRSYTCSGDDDCPDVISKNRVAKYQLHATSELFELVACRKLTPAEATQIMIDRDKNTLWAKFKCFVFGR